MSATERIEVDRRVRLVLAVGGDRLDRQVGLIVYSTSSETPWCVDFLLVAHHRIQVGAGVVDVARIGAPLVRPTIRRWPFFGLRIVLGLVAGEAHEQVRGRGQLDGSAPAFTSLS
jgi:hypothetical protein